MCVMDCIRDTMVLVLFSLYCGVLAYDWRRRWSAAGVELQYKHDHKLIWDGTAKSLMTSQFTDNVDICGCGNL